MRASIRTPALAAMLTLPALALTACGGGGSSPGNGGAAGPPPPVTVTRTYPSGRAIPVNGGTAWNIVGVTTILTGTMGNSGGNLYDTLTIRTTFDQDVTNALPAPGQTLALPTQLGVGTYFNTSGPAGGFNDCTSQARDGYFIEGGSRNSDGSYGIFGENGLLTGVEAQTSATGHVVTQSLPLGAIGVFAGMNIPDFKISVGAANGAPGNVAFTDCVPPDGSQIPVNGP